MVAHGNQLMPGVAGTHSNHCWVKFVGARQHTATPDRRTQLDAHRNIELRQPLDWLDLPQDLPVSVVLATGAHTSNVTQYESDAGTFTVTRREPWTLRISSN